jgi:hypothetical protein
VLRALRLRISVFMGRATNMLFTCARRATFRLFASRCVYLSAQVGLLCDRDGLHAVLKEMHFMGGTEASGVAGTPGCKGGSQRWLAAQCLQLCHLRRMLQGHPGRRAGQLPPVKQHSLDSQAASGLPERRHFACGCALM